MMKAKKGHKHIVSTFPVILLGTGQFVMLQNHLQNKTDDKAEQ